MMPDQNTNFARQLLRNVEAVAKIEASLVGARSVGARFIRWMIRRVGTPASAAIHSAVFVGWITGNAGLLPPAWHFDPPPFQTLELVATIEAILLGLLILASQNRLQQEEDQRAHLNLQVNLLAESETTKMLHMLDQLCQHLGMERLKGEELDELKLQTDPAAIVETLKTTMPDDR